MIIVLDASAAVGISLNRSDAMPLLEHVEKAEWVIAPDLYISEVTNVIWKYHQFEDLPLDVCESVLHTAISLTDEFISAEELYTEAFALACQAGHPVYDALYLVCARRYNAMLISSDQRLMKLAKKHAIKTG